MKKRLNSRLHLLVSAGVYVTLCFFLPSFSTAIQNDTQGKGANGQTTMMDQQAIDALHSMSMFLRSLSSFDVESTFYKDNVLASGQKILVNGTSHLAVVVPHRLFAQVDFAESEQSYALYYNGSTLSLFAKKPGYYTTLAAPDTLRDLVTTTFAEKGIELPLQDLFLWGTDSDKNAQLTAAMVIGPSILDGKPCSHYAYRQQDVDWQIWIQEGQQPLPLQLVITTTSDSAQPQYAARIHWNLQPSHPDAMFTFTPPPKAQAIDFFPAPQTSNQ